MGTDSIIGVSISDADMTEVRKDFFFDGMGLPVTVYLKLTLNHYLMIGKESEKSNFSTLHSYQNPNSLIFVSNKDVARLMSYLTQMTEKVVMQKNIPDAFKAKFLVGLTENALESFEGKGFASTAELQRVSGMIVEMGKHVSNFTDVISILSTLEGDDAKHSMTTCMASVMICEEMQMTLKGAIEKVALGSLIHDLGMKVLPKTLLEKPKHLWTHDDNLLYESHPLKGVEMLRHLKDIPTDVLLIVAEHHENALGTGFPKRIRDVKISPLSRIVIVANCFSDLVMSRFGHSQVYTAEEALNYMSEIIGQPFNKQVFSALRNIVNKTALRDKMRAG